MNFFIKKLHNDNNHLYAGSLSSKNFIKQYKKTDVRIKKAFDKQFAIFAKNPNDLQLRNHPLRDNWKGFRSIDITGNWRAVYKDLQEGKEHIAYFVTLGTHTELYN